MAAEETAAAAAKVAAAAAAANGGGGDVSCGACGGAQRHSEALHTRHDCLVNTGLVYFAIPVVP
jgi:hypothetical protein